MQTKNIWKIWIDLYDFSPQATKEMECPFGAEPTVTVREARESKSHKSVQIKQITIEKKIWKIWIDLYDFSP